MNNSYQNYHIIMFKGVSFLLGIPIGAWFQGLFLHFEGDRTTPPLPQIPIRPCYRDHYSEPSKSWPFSMRIQYL